MSPDGSQASFTGIPAEMRQHIYEELLHCNRFRYIRGIRKRVHPPHLAIMSASRLTFAECQPLVQKSFVQVTCTTEDGYLPECFVPIIARLTKEQSGYLPNVELEDGRRGGLNATRTTHVVISTWHLEVYLEISNSCEASQLVSRFGSAWEHARIDTGLSANPIAARFYKLVQEQADSPEAISSRRIEKVLQSHRTQLEHAVADSLYRGQLWSFIPMIERLLWAWDYWRNTVEFQRQLGSYQTQIASILAASCMNALFTSQREVMLALDTVQRAMVAIPEMVGSAPSAIGIRIEWLQTTMSLSRGGTTIEQARSAKRKLVDLSRDEEYTPKALLDDIAYLDKLEHTSLFPQAADGLSYAKRTLEAPLELALTDGTIQLFFTLAGDAPQ